MDNSKVYLSYYEVMILLYEFEECRNEEDNYITLLIEQFYNYFLEQIEFNTSRGVQFNIPDIVLKNLKIYAMSVSLYELLLKLTGINFKDKRLRKYYKNYIRSYERFLYDSKLLCIHKMLLKKKRDN